jgi:hypothetical protein
LIASGFALLPRAKSDRRQFIGWPVAMMLAHWHWINVQLRQL